MGTQTVFRPGSIVFDQSWQQGYLRYQKAVQRASFLKDSEKDDWLMLGYRLNSQELLGAERVIVEEDLRRLKTRHQLASLKPLK